MSIDKIYVYHKEKFNEFYKSFSEEYNIISISSLLNISSQFEESYFSYEKTLVDITSMIKLVDVREDVIIFYEVLINHLYQEGNVKLIVENNYVNKVFEIFPEYFSEKEYLTDIIDYQNEEILNDDNLSESHNITVYSKDNFDKFLEDRENEGIEVISITKIMKSISGVGYSFKLDELAGSKKYIFDITSMVSMANLRSDLIMQFEITLNELSRFKNVEFAIEKNNKGICQKLFKYNFKEYIELDKITTNNTKRDSKKIVDMTNEEIDTFLKRFDVELIGHIEFKEDLKKQIKKYIILNKMKEKPIFSILLCGKSGIGKTEVARIFHRILYNKSKEIKINFGNYSERGSLWSLIGSPKGFHGSERGGELTNKIINSDSKVILIDEFEKADSSIYSFFYELLEDGKFTDLDENEIDLNGYIIIFTSNLDENNYKNTIPDPLFSRFSMRYLFVSLSSKDKQDFLKLRTNQLISKYNEVFDTKLEMTKRDFLLNIDVADLDNLRDIDIRLTDKFIELIE